MRSFLPSTSSKIVGGIGRGLSRRSAGPGQAFGSLQSGHSSTSKFWASRTWSGILYRSPVVTGLNQFLSTWNCLAYHTNLGKRIKFQSKRAGHIRDLRRQRIVLATWSYENLDWATNYRLRTETGLGRSLTISRLGKKLIVEEGSSTLRAQEQTSSCPVPVPEHLASTILGCRLPFKYTAAAKPEKKSIHS